jgi:hypothetical protein
MRGFVERLINRLREVGLVEKLLKIDEAVTLEKDYLLLLLVRCLRRGRASWRRLASENMKSQANFLGMNLIFWTDYG